MVPGRSFWCLAWVAFLSLQVVEDGTLPSVAVRSTSRACRAQQLTPLA